MSNSYLKAGSLAFMPPGDEMHKGFPLSSLQTSVGKQVNSWRGVYHVQVLSGH